MDINEQADPAGIGIPSSEAFGSTALSAEKDAGAASWGAGRPEGQPVGPGIGRPPTEYEMAYLAMDTLRKDVRLRQGLAVALNESEMDLLYRVETGVHNLSKRAAAKGRGSVVLEQTEPHGVYVPSVDPYAREAEPNAGEASYNFTEHVEPPSEGGGDSAGDGPAIHLPEELARKPSFIDQVREILGTPSSSDHEALTVMIGVAIEALRQCDRPYSNLPDAARQEVLGHTVRRLFEDLTRETPSPESISSVETRRFPGGLGRDLSHPGNFQPDWQPPKKVYDYDLDFKGTLLEHMERSNCPGFQSAAARLLIGDERLAELQAGNRRAVQDLARELTEKRDALRSRLPRVSEGVSPPGESAADAVQRLQGEDAKSIYKD